MKRVFILIVFGLSFASSYGQDSFWRDMSDREKGEILKHKRISPAVRDFYFGHRHAGDAVSEDALMGTLAKADSSQLPFYFEVFCKRMPSYRDSLDRAAFTVHVMNMLYYHPDYVAAYLRTHDDPECEKLFYEAVSYAFEELPFLYPDKPGFLADLLSNTGPRNRKALEDLFK